MPGWGATAGGELTDAEILAVVCHERYDLGGADPTSDEYAEEFEDWCAEEAPIYAGLEDGHRARRPRRPSSTTPTATSPDHRRSATRRPPARRPGDATHGRVDASTPATASVRRSTTDVLVVGGGPAGAAAAYWLARHGHDVTVVERKTFPREKTAATG